MTLRTFHIYFCLLLLSFSYYSHADRDSKVENEKSQFTILLLKPNGNDLPFWQMTENFVRTVANDLNINLISSHLPSILEGQSLERSSLSVYFKHDGRNVDAIISSLPIYQLDVFLASFNDSGIPFITINNPLLKSKLHELGRPRDKLKHWLAHISPDEVEASLRLSAILLSRVCKDEQANLISMSGHLDTGVTQLRLSGLRNSRGYGRGFKQVQHIETDWSSLDAKGKLSTLLSQTSSKDFNILWTASGDIAQGALASLKNHHYRPSRDVFVGSIDWDNNIVSLIEEGILEVSLGGHFVEAGIAALLLNDYLHGKEFVNETGSIIKTKLETMSYANVRKLRPKLNPKHWQSIDFKKQTKHFNADLKAYELSPRALLKLN